jgi:cyclopropane-fatty-acyl-phospholipid synthase
MFETFFKKQVLSALEPIGQGFLRVKDGDEQYSYGDEASAPEELCATITVEHPKFYRLVGLGGSLGAAEAYVQGLWSCDDLTAVVRLMLRNVDEVAGLDQGVGRFKEPLQKLFHRFRANSKAGSRKNIHAHYDLGNSFFKEFLDDTMTYSCGIFDRPEMTMREASISKLDRMCRKLSLSPDDHVLEIGTGWGSFAMHAASEYGCKVTTATISEEQFEMASQRIQEAGLNERIEVKFCDYRDLTGTYDKLASIEMIEAVGAKFLDGYFHVLNERVAPHGLVALQAITIRDQEYERYTANCDFIQRYVFPGSSLPSVGSICNALARAGGDLQFCHLEDLTPHYVTTLEIWQQRFRERLDEIRKLGFGDQFLRLWDYYFSYCAGGFAERWIGVAQLVFTKPQSKVPPILPALG